METPGVKDFIKHAGYFVPKSFLAAILTSSSLMGVPELQSELDSIRQSPIASAHIKIDFGDEETKKSGDTDSGENAVGYKYKGFTIVTDASIPFDEQGRSRFFSRGRVNYSAAQQAAHAARTAKSFVRSVSRGTPLATPIAGAPSGPMG